MSSNKSMAIWCTPNHGAQPIELEVHFNYWRVTDEPGRFRWPWQRREPAAKADFVEIGIMVDDARKVDTASIYVPARFDVGAVCDCAPFFTDPEVVQGIFNERLTAAPASNGLGPLLIRKASSGIFCRMHRFGFAAGTQPGLVGNELSITPYADGVLFVVKPTVFAACCAPRGSAKAYIRLRIEMPRGDDNPFVEDVPVPDRFLVSGYDQIEYLDFRLNEARTLPTSIENRIAREQPSGSVLIRLVAFLTAIPVSAELSVANTEFHKMRLLEYAIWSGYARGIPRGMVVYHWKRVAATGKAIQDFSAFVKLQTRRSGRRVLILYLGFAFLFGVLGNLFASYIEPSVRALFGQPYHYVLGRIAGALAVAGTAIVCAYQVVAGWWAGIRSR
jgi:hypothetical protein